MQKLKTQTKIKHDGLEFLFLFNKIAYLKQNTINAFKNLPFYYGCNTWHL